MRAFHTFLMVIVATLLLASPLCQAQIDPVGGQPKDSDLAVKNPDKYAWELFFFLNHQAGPEPGVADATQGSIAEYDDDKSVVWESWALASGGRVENEADNTSEVYLHRGQKPLLGVLGLATGRNLPRSP